MPAGALLITRTHGRVLGPSLGVFHDPGVGVKEMMWTWLETHACGQGPGSKELGIPPSIFSSVSSQKPLN